MTILLQDRHWGRMRTSFSGPEKEQLRAATVGEVICPAGVTLDESLLNAALVAKLKVHIENAKTAFFTGRAR